MVSIEALITFLPIFLSFLCMVQLALNAATGLAVRHAATVGARAAMVVFVEPPRRYGGEPRRRITPGRDATRPAGFSLSGAPPAGESRADAVRRAVAFVLAPFAPRAPLGLGELASGAPFGRSLAASVGGAGERLALGMSLYPDLALAVTFPEAPGSDALFERRVNGDRVTVRVTYLAACVVPVAARLLCDGASRLLPGRDVGELTFVRSPRALRTVLGLGARFAVLRAEATMPLQTAGYEEDGA